MVDAVTASGLAGNLDAPILLTRTNRLPHNVARYIDDHNVTHVVIVGGTAAVSDAVVTAIEGLGSAPSTERVPGADRYETAAAIGSRLGGPNPTWCDSTQTAAVLVNGGDAGRADAIAVGPIANNLGLPVLLTTADELPQSTSDFLTDDAVEHVVIVGGTGAVSDSVREAMIEDVGVITVRRIAGSDAAGTSVELAEEMLGKCADVVGANHDMVALVNRDATADGVAAAPAMGFGLGNGPIPILLVSDELPSSVSDYLSSTAESRDGLKTHLRIVAIGGTAVVSDAVMQAAVAAAKTSPALTATITPVFVPGSANDAFTVTFSDDVKLPKVLEGETNAGQVIYDGANTALTDDIADGTVLDPTLYRINGTRIEALLADPAADTSNQRPEDEDVVNRIFVEDRTVRIDLFRDFKNGDVISVAGGGKLGDNMDERRLEAASTTVSVAAPAADRSAPVIEIVAYPGSTGNTFDVIVTEDNPLLVTGTSDVYMAPGGVTINGEEATLVDPSPAVNRPTDPDRDGDVDVRRYRYTAPADALTARGTSDTAIEAGDVVEVARNTFQDKGNRGNRLTRSTVTAVKKLQISSVSIGNADHTVAQASANIGAVQDTADMTITALKTGVAAGANGNGWVIYGYEDPSATDTPPALPVSADISVEVDTTHKIIAYTINRHSRFTPGVSLFDLARALVANETFAANFSVDYADTDTNRLKDDPLGETDATGVPLEDGLSQVAVRVNFNDVALTVPDSVASDTDTQLAEAIAGRRPDATTPEYTVWRPQSDDFVPDRVVYYTYQSGNPLHLPQRGGTRTVASGVATNGFTDPDDKYAGVDTDSMSAILRSLRPDSRLLRFVDPN